MHPKMLLYALDELFHVFTGVGANNLNGQCVVAYEILSFASLHCMEQRGKPINPCKTCRNTSSMVDVDDQKGLERLTWAIYDGVLLPSSPLQLQGRHDWVRIIVGTYHLVFWGEYNYDHCPPCNAASFNAKQAMRRPSSNAGVRNHQQPHHQQLHLHLEHAELPLCDLQLTCHRGWPHHLQLRGPWQPPKTTMRRMKRMAPSINFMPIGFSWRALGGKHPRFRLCAIRPPQLTPCGRQLGG